MPTIAPPTRRRICGGPEAVIDLTKPCIQYSAIGFDQSRMVGCTCGPLGLFLSCICSSAELMKKTANHSRASRLDVAQTTNHYSRNRPINSAVLRHAPVLFVCRFAANSCTLSTFSLRCFLPLHTITIQPRDCPLRSSSFTLSAACFAHTPSPSSLDSSNLSCRSFSSTRSMLAQPA